jgi:hypothetical protein
MIKCKYEDSGTWLKWQTACLNSAGPQVQTLALWEKKEESMAWEEMLATKNKGKSDYSKEYPQKVILLYFDFDCIAFLL